MSESGDVPAQSATSTESSAYASQELDGGAGMGWFSSSLKDLTSLGRSLKECIPPAIDGIAGAIHRSVATVAAEFSQMELDADSCARGRRVEHSLDNGDDDETSDDGRFAVLPLPWEVYSEISERYEENEELKYQILALSSNETTFQGPHRPDNNEDPAEVDNYLDGSRVGLIRRLFGLDEELGKIHAKLSGRSDIKEITFWKNYFHHCDRIKAQHELGAEFVDTPTTCTIEGVSRPSTPPSDEDDIEEETGAVNVSPPKVKSIGDLVLVGCEIDDLDDLADEINRDSSK